MNFQKRSRFISFAFIAAILLCNGCVSVHMKSAQAGRRVTLPTGPGFEKTALTQQALQSTLLTFADRSVIQIRFVWTDTLDKSLTQRVTADQSSLAQSSTILSIASEPSVEQSLIDMMIYMDLQSADLQHYGPAPVAAAFAGLNKEAWKLGTDVLTPQELDELRAIIKQWKQTHPNRADVRFARLGSMVPIPGQTTLLTRLSNGDPGRLAPMNPDTRTVEEAGLLAERSLFLLGRVPVLARWNAGLALSEAAGTPEFQTLVRNTSQLASSSTSLARFTDTFPQQVRAGRNAFFSDLGTQQVSAERLIAQTQALLLEARKTNESMQATLAGVHGLMGAANVSSGNGPGKPFNIESYARTAEQLRLAAAEANELTRNVSELSDSPQFSSQVRALDAGSDRKMQTASNQMKSVVDHAMLRAIELVIFIFLMLIGYKFLMRRLQEPKATTPRSFDDQAGRGFGQKAS
jgi:hypothetical protein